MPLLHPLFLFYFLLLAFILFLFDYNKTLIKEFDNKTEVVRVLTLIRCRFFCQLHFKSRITQLEFIYQCFHLWFTNLLPQIFFHMIQLGKCQFFVYLFILCCILVLLISCSLLAPISCLHALQWWLHGIFQDEFPDSDSNRPCLHSVCGRRHL